MAWIVFVMGHLLVLSAGYVWYRRQHQPRNPAQVLTPILGVGTLGARAAHAAATLPTVDADITSVSNKKAAAEAADREAVPLPPSTLAGLGGYTAITYILFLVESGLSWALTEASGMLVGAAAAGAGLGAAGVLFAFVHALIGAVLRLTCGDRPLVLLRRAKIGAIVFGACTLLAVFLVSAARGLSASGTETAATLGLTIALVSSSLGGGSAGIVVSLLLELRDQTTRVARLTADLVILRQLRDELVRLSVPPSPPPTDPGPFDPTASEPMASHSRPNTSASGAVN